MKKKYIVGIVLALILLSTVVIGYNLKGNVDKEIKEKVHEEATKKALEQNITELDYLVNEGIESVETEITENLKDDLVRECQRIEWSGDLDMIEQAIKKLESIK